MVYDVAMSAGVPRRLDPAARARREAFRVSLTDQVHEVLRDRIVRRELAPGAKLDVGELAHELGTSRMPVVDALNRLEMEGLIDRRDRVGSFVTPLSPGDFEELFEARRMVEQWAIVPIAARMSDVDRDALREILRESQALLRDADDRTFDYRRTLELDQAFHLKLMEIAGNRRILAWYRSLNAHIQVGRVYSLRALNRCRGAYKEHEALLAALEARDVRAAHAALDAHLDVSKAGLLEILRARGDL